VRRHFNWSAVGPYSTRWAAGDATHFGKYAAELVALAPDVILAAGGAVVPSLLLAGKLAATFWPDHPSLLVCELTR
jgi:hypothetical protein